MTDATLSEPEPYVVALSVDGTEALSFDMTSSHGWAAYYSVAVTAARAMVLLRIGPEAGPPGKPHVHADGTPGLVWPAGHALQVPLEVRELRIAVGQQTAGFGSSLLREIPFTRIEAAVNQPEHRTVLAERLLPVNAFMDGEMPGGTRYLVPPEPVKLRRANLRVKDPGGYRKPDDFYRQVADRYLWLAAITARPAQDLAAANGTPVATVHRWIREAKARGLLLLPAHRGEARPGLRIAYAGAKVGGRQSAADDDLPPEPEWLDSPSENEGGKGNDDSGL